MASHPTLTCLSKAQQSLSLRYGVAWKVSFLHFSAWSETGSFIAPLVTANQPWYRGLRGKTLLKLVKFFEATPDLNSKDTGCIHA